MTHILTLENTTALITLTFLEIVLGIDNLIFISILVGRVSKEQRDLARILGMAFALVTRILLLLSLSAIMKLTTPFIEIASFSFSGRDIILFLGGLFLVGKATHEIHEKMEEHASETPVERKKAKFLSIIIQIALIDIIFSLDSVITAIGMASNIFIMILAIVISMIIMLISSKSVTKFIEKHPTFKMLALSFLVLIGVVLISESLHQPISKGYIYCAIGFSLFVETLNIRLRKKGH